jgi:hypothetical protein
MGIKFEIAGLYFKTKKELTEYTRQLFIVKRPEINKWDKEFNFVVELFKRHPEFTQKAGPGIEKLRLFPDKANPDRGTMVMIVRSDGTQIDISWRTAIDGKHWSEDRIRLAEFRKQASQLTMKFKVESLTITSRCSICELELTWNNCHVDHKVPFSILVQEFDKLNIGNEHFQRFHDERASLQLLCKACNIKKGATCLEGIGNEVML